MWTQSLMYCVFSYSPFCHYKKNVKTEKSKEKHNREYKMEEVLDKPKYPDTHKLMRRQKEIV